MNKGMIWE